MTFGIVQLAFRIGYVYTSSKSFCVNVNVNANGVKYENTSTNQRLDTDKAK